MDAADEMTKVAVLLKRYITEKKMTSDEFAAKAKVNPGNFSKILRGKLGVSRSNLAGFVRACSDNAELQADLVAAHLFDYLPNNCRSLVEVRKRVGVTSSEFIAPSDELEATLERAKLVRREPLVEPLILALNQAIKFTEIQSRKRTE